MMANKEHVRILEQGVDAWNLWRRREIDVVPQLDGIDLSGAMLSALHSEKAMRIETGIDMLFGGVDLRRANLTGTNLSSASLEGADLSHADLRHANLQRTDLFGARLRRAILTETDLRRALLTGADFTGALFRRTMMDGAIVGHTQFGSDFTEVSGLSSLVHLAPSLLDIGIIYCSNMLLPKVFLQGIGLPESFIEHYQTLMPSTFYACFISHCSKDHYFAQRLHDNLQRNGVRCWYAPEDMKIGDRIRERIDESIRLHDKLLLVLSEHSVASSWVEQEVETALERERRLSKTVLFPIRLDDAVMEIETGWPALIRNTRHIGDFTRWKDHDAYNAAFERLLRDLKAEEG